MPLDNAGVLIADDDAAICYSLARETRRAGMIPIVAGDGLEAVELFDAAMTPIRAAFLDVCMPRLDGAAASLALRQRQSDLPICLMSARVDESFVESLKVHFLAKPFNLDNFSRLLSELVRERLVEAHAVLPT